MILFLLIFSIKFFFVLVKVMPVRFVLHTSNLIPNSSIIPENAEIYVFDLLLSEWVLQSWIVPRPASPKTIMHRL